MVATFCLRLACGMIACLGVLSPSPIPPRFFRVHYLVAMGLLSVAGWFYLSPVEEWVVASWTFSMALCFVGAILWEIDEAPGTKVLAGVAIPTLVSALILGGLVIRDWSVDWRIVDDLAAAAVLGSALSAMLMGHTYLISPAMSIQPLNRLLAALGAALAARVALACLGLWWWTSQRGSGNLETETILWLSARWGLGLVGPMVLGWMAWETARIRSTQSATGILYVVTIVTFLGELTSLLLVDKTGFIL